MTIESRLDLLQNQLNIITELMQLSINALNTKKAVSKFLNKSEKTIDNYIKNNTFLEHKHYFYNENKKVEFIPSAIVHFKKNPIHKIKIVEEREEENKTLVLSETSSKILKGIL